MWRGGQVFRPGQEVRLEAQEGAFLEQKGWVSFVESALPPADSEASVAEKPAAEESPAEEAPAEEPTAEAPAEASALTAVTGIGETRAGQLEALGIATLADLAAADVAALASSLSVSESTAQAWIDEAASLAGSAE
jgi:predicted flap endonuclease-1-like 5' DNA nuclease